MISLPEGISQRDIVQWLSSGWFLFKRDEASAPEVGQLGSDRSGDGYNIRDIEQASHAIVPSRVFPFWPQCGAINLNGFAVYIERRQVRQYRRTYNDMCITLTIPRKWDVMKKNGTDAVAIGPNTKEVVQAAFSPRYYTYTEAIGLMESGRAVSVALNPHLIVAGPLVYYRNKLVAKMDGPRIVPMGCDNARIRRILKFFEGRVSL